MYIDQTNGRRSPIFLATLLLMVLALSLFNLGPRFDNDLELTGRPGSGGTESVQYELFASQRNTYYAFADEQTADAWNSSVSNARDIAAVYITQSMSGRDYTVHFDTGASFVVTPGLLRTSIYTSDQGTFTGSLALSDGFTDSQGRRLEQVYPLYADSVTRIARQDSTVLLAHWPLILVSLVLIVIGLVITAKQRQITWLSQYRWQPFAIMATAILFVLAGLFVSARII